MNVPGKRAVTLLLIVASGLTPISIVSTVVNQPSTVESQSYAPSYIDARVYSPRVSTVDRSSRSAIRVEQVPYTADTASAAALSKVEIVIKFAMAQRGKPYVWGTAGPNSYDCSGLVLRSFAQVHIRLPHFTGAMIHYGRSISRSQLRPGDIIFPSSHHVAIYIGHNHMVVAPHSGTRVQVQTVYAFYAARRLL